MTPPKAFLSRPILGLIAACSLPLAVLPLMQCLALAPFGSRGLLSFQMLILLLFMAALLALVGAPFLSIVRRFRPFAVRSLIGAAVFAVATVAGLRLGGNIRTAAFRSLAARSVPLVQAIRAYEARHGAPPADLTRPGAGISARRSRDPHWRLPAIRVSCWRRGSLSLWRQSLGAGRLYAVRLP